ncbi:hypothetical protein NEUTE1DRAFT_65730 [Neurospora tetrasperma FGSC 2508]|uniref:Uncharacterized protein n=1 Tax=Neurospora tetrasperma (strain FGSC 2508 / ATCC MYA-4615 / P0657) TaxID=510951 RepID=F8MRB0_NEUT8|nr:uncharacterized protein NEUTE1DRAFT_65730 [Neurospora tetrasperma FGSC 2508]EGO56864.1 hypothetical protein NEUTE1DRAFT_65730 [Neurospora tetrasperma FGSC 2508]EGZ70245.1 hypothetical protein NEUTE2DRAFT_112845 [Neurospora tetrasperma FGSC 2509]
MMDRGSMAARKSTLYLLYIHMEAIGTRDSMVYRGIIGVKGEASARCLADSPRLHSAPVTKNRCGWSEAFDIIDRIEEKMRSGIEDWWVSPLLRAK